MISKNEQSDLGLPAAPTAERSIASIDTTVQTYCPANADSGKPPRQRKDRTLFRTVAGEECAHSGNAGRVLQLLASNPDGITQFTTYPWHTRLAASIQMLRLSGLDIQTEREGPSRHARYILVTQGELVVPNTEEVP